MLIVCSQITNEMHIGRQPVTLQIIIIKLLENCKLTMLYFVHINKCKYLLTN